MSKTIVTGGNGLVGKYLQKYVEAVYLSSKDYDLTDEQSVIKMYSDYNPDIVIHLAAKVGGILDNIQYPFEYYEDNVMMNTYVVKHARLSRVKKFVGVLSTCAYPDVSNNYPMVEEDLHLGVPNENNYGYGYSKRLMGVHIDIAKKQGLDYSYIIPSNLYGEYESGDYNKRHFVGALLDKINVANKEGRDHIVLFGDGTPLRQFTFAEDIAKILCLILDHNITENLNVSTEENMSIDEMARKALIATNSTHLNIEYDRTKPNGQYRKDVSTKKLKDIFPNYEFISYIEGIKRTYETINK